MSGSCDTCRHWRRFNDADFIRPDDKVLGRPPGARTEENGLCKAEGMTYDRVVAGKVEIARYFSHETYSCEKYKPSD